MLCVNIENLDLSNRYIEGNNAYMFLDISDAHLHINLIDIYLDVILLLLVIPQCIFFFIKACGRYALLISRSTTLSA